MNRIVSWRHALVVVVGLFLTGGLTGQATVIDQMSFEEVARQADVVLVGRVIETPELGVYDKASRHVRVFNRVAVADYLKGEGPSEVTVVTFGGQFDMVTDEGVQRQELAYGGVAQLPDEGTAVLLFLKVYGDSFIIYSTSHGVILVQGTGEERWVNLVFRESSAMPTLARRDYERARGAGYSGNWHLFGDRVLIRDLPAQMDHALRSSTDSGVLSIESYVPGGRTRTEQ